MDQVDDYGPESNSSDFEERAKNTRASGYTSPSLHDYGLRTEIGLGLQRISQFNTNIIFLKQLTIENC